LAGTTVGRITDNLAILRVDDSSTHYFEGLWEIPEGITYNAYLLDTGEGFILFDGWKRVYASELLRILEGLLDPGDLKYIVVHHMEPDHTGSLPLVASWARDAKILGHPMAFKIMGGRVAAERFRPVRDGEELALGGYKLKFIYAPWIHWPETMFTYVEGDSVLLTCDAFGGYGIPRAVFDDECRDMDWYLYTAKKYLVTVVGRYRGFVVKALDKLSKLGVEPSIVAPGHGLVWRKDPRLIMDHYRRISSGELVEGKAVVVYASMYGSTERLALHAAKALSQAGYRVSVYGFTDSKRPSIADTLADIADSELLVIALPTYEADPYPLIEYLVGLICEKASAPRRAAVLGSYSWGGVGAKAIASMLEKCGHKVVYVGERQRIHATLREVEEEVESLLKAVGSPRGA